jgi:hypothetical protein
MERSPAFSPAPPERAPLPNIGARMRAALLPVLLGLAAPALASVEAIAQSPAQDERAEMMKKREQEVLLLIPKADEPALIAFLDEPSFRARSAAQEELIRRVTTLTQKEGRTELLRLLPAAQPNLHEIIWRGKSLGTTSYEQNHRLEMLLDDFDEAETRALHVGTVCTLPAEQMKLGDVLSALSKQVGREVKLMQNPEYLHQEVRVPKEGKLWSILDAIRLQGDMRLRVCYSTKSSVDILVAQPQYSTVAVEDGVLAQCFESHFIHILMEPKADCRKMMIKKLSVLRTGESKAENILPMQSPKQNWALGFNAALPYAKRKGETATLIMTVALSYDRTRKYTVEDISRPATFASSSTELKYMAARPSREDAQVYEIWTERTRQSNGCYQSMDVRAEDAQGNPVYSHGSTENRGICAHRMEKGKIPVRVHFYMLDGVSDEKLVSVERTFVFTSVPLREMRIPGSP